MSIHLFYHYTYYYCYYYWWLCLIWYYYYYYYYYYYWWLRLIHYYYLFLLLSNTIYIFIFHAFVCDPKVCNSNRFSNRIELFECGDDVWDVLEDEMFLLSRSNNFFTFFTLLAVLFRCFLLGIAIFSQNINIENFV